MYLHARSLVRVLAPVLKIVAYQNATGPNQGPNQDPSQDPSQDQGQSLGQSHADCYR